MPFLKAYLNCKTVYEKFYKVATHAFLNYAQRDLAFAVAASSSYNIKGNTQTAVLFRARKAS